MNKSANWSEYWKNEGINDEVFVNQEGKKHQALAEFWQQQLQELGGTGKLIDLASGAGSVFADVAFAHEFDLHAADISSEALERLESRLPGVTTHVCSADSLPLESHSFDLVVSQFGIEYAGIHAFTEAARIVKPSGSMIILCHIHDGYIDRRNRTSLEGAKLVHKIEFIAKAKAVTEANFGQDESEVKRTLDDFIAVEPTLSGFVRANPQGVHAHLYNGFKQLFLKRNAYQLTDIIDWLDSMQSEVDNSILRLEEMCRVASTEKTMHEIADNLSVANMLEVQYSPFILPHHSLPVAWKLTATKMAEKTD